MTSTTYQTGEAVLESETETVYLSRMSWSPARPHVLVVACSDGRLQQNIDDFLHNHLGIDNYDRLYMPGGPGALAQSGYEYSRADQFRRESAFLVEAHAIEEVILLFHSAAADGPIEAHCADYGRKLPSHEPHQVRPQQEEDAAEVLQRVFGPGAFSRNTVRVRVYRAEVRSDGNVQFVALKN